MRIFGGGLAMVVVAVLMVTLVGYVASELEADKPARRYLGLMRLSIP
jgi:uncharacterized membrane protein